MLDMMKGYLQLAAGLGEMSRRRALDAARELVEASPVAGMLPGTAGGAEAVTAQVTAVADELLAIGRQNRRLITQLVRTETHAVLASLGAVSENGGPATGALERQLRTLRQRVDDLERQLRERAGAAVTSTAGAVRRPGSVASWTSSAPDASPSPTAPVGTSRATRASRDALSTAKAAPRKAAPRKAATRKATASTTSAERTAAPARSTATTAGAKRTAKKTTAKRAPAKKTTATKTIAKRAAAKKATAARTARPTTSAQRTTAVGSRGRQQGATS